MKRTVIGKGRVIFWVSLSRRQKLEIEKSVINCNYHACLHWCWSTPLPIHMVAGWCHHCSSFWLMMTLQVLLNQPLTLLVLRELSWSAPDFSYLLQVNSPITSLLQAFSKYLVFLAFQTFHIYYNKGYCGKNRHKYTLLFNLIRNSTTVHLVSILQYNVETITKAVPL